MISGEQFLEELSQHSDRQGRINLLNFYKGMLIEVTASLKSTSKDKAVLAVAPPNSICLSWENETWLQMEETDLMGRATVESFDLLTARVVLGNFNAEKNPFNRRSVIRVEPHSEIQVAVENTNHRMIEYLADISTKGIGVRIPALESQQVFENAEAVKVSIKLPQGKSVVPGVIQNITRSKDFYRLGVLFSEEQDHNPAITAYIAYRTDAIFKILKIHYDLEIRKQWQEAVTAFDEP